MPGRGSKAIDDRPTNRTPISLSPGAGSWALHLRGKGTWALHLRGKGAWALVLKGERALYSRPLERANSRG